MNKKYNYKYVIGIMLGIILWGGSVYATIKYPANVFYYNNASSTLNSTNVQGAIDELANKYASLSSCPSNKVCLAKKTTLAVGDYVSYTPTKTSYTTDITYTGYTYTQTINPSELNLWRVLSINGDGTVDLISEYVSSVNVSFRGQTGYQNIVGYLNVLASQYETPGITVGSRHFGYNGQTELITNTQYFVNPAPWTCSTGRTCTPDPDDYESSGGGDILYLNDYNLVNTVLGTRVANKAGTTTAAYYWMASRYYDYSSATNYGWHGRFIATNNIEVTGYLYWRNNSYFSTNGYGQALRPIITISANVTYNGVGSKEFPMEIIPPTIKYIVNNSGQSMLIGDPIPAGVYARSTAEAAMADWAAITGITNDTRPFYLKHTLNRNNEIAESYVEFVVTPAMASSNPGMTAGTYTIRGLDTYDLHANCKSDYETQYMGDIYCLSPYFDDNISVLENAFGTNSAYCSSDEFHCICNVSGLQVNTEYNGMVGVVDGDGYSCTIEFDGSLGCG